MRTIWEVIEVRFEEKHFFKLDFFHFIHGTTTFINLFMGRKKVYMLYCKLRLWEQIKLNRILRGYAWITFSSKLLTFIALVLLDFEGLEPLNSSKYNVKAIAKNLSNNGNANKYHSSKRWQLNVPLYSFYTPATVNCSSFHSIAFSQATPFSTSWSCGTYDLSPVDGYLN